VKLKKIILILVIVISLVILFILTFPKVEFNDEIIYVGNDFNPSVKVYNYFSDISNKVKISNTVDVNKIGKYNITCSFKYLFFNVKRSFTVEVIDNEFPVITLSGSNPSFSCPNKEYVEEGYSAIDNYDGDITDKVIVKKENGNILYTVLDTSGNGNVIERKIIYDDKETPTITLNGDSTVGVYLGNRYNEPGYSAYDNCDGDITSNVIVSGSVDASKIGAYTLKYEITDSSNNTFSIERTIVVRKKVNSYGNGKIYLTFDDGSSYLTNQILDILNSENVKATFFVVHANEITKRIYDSGHAIGLHSNTHNYSYIYSSVDNYFDDLNKINNKVYKIIGFNPKIIRFPGGSSNTVSRNYKTGIMTYLTGEVLNRGYIYFDWNIDSNDAGSDIYNSNNIYYNVVNNLSHSKTNVVLMHDSAGHEATVNALKKIIEYGKAYGYSFDVITEDTPVVEHSVNN